MVTVNPLPTGTFRVEIDADHGGRWTSLIDRAGREWLWSQPCPARSQVRPGDAFVDAGGVEECFPTVTGVPDHGDVWTRAWAADGGGMTVKTGAFTLHRRLSVGTDITVDYRLTGPPGAAFVWAFHALLRPDVGSRIVADATLSRIWAEDGQPVDDHWPVIADRPGGDVLGPDDGSAVFCVLPQLHGVSVQQGDARLRLDCDEAPVSFGIWRNLGGFPASGLRYRSFGIEPMLGRAPTVLPATSGEAALVPASGELAWRLVIS